ncbi:MAG: DUF2849 domain-containing protein [Parvularcula sp.]|jgi:hypothetical protein|nr:DUF2849 domain-containing protein [Parvularcula sp.]
MRAAQQRQAESRAVPPAKISAGGVKKTRNEGLKAVTANDLFTGAVVYRTAHGGWSADLRDAAIFEGDDALSALSLATADEASVVGPYLMDVSPEKAPAGRAALRETIRRSGPTVSVPESGVHDVSL